MPGFDNTGPNGQGQGTGRRMGPCFSSNYQRGAAGGRRMGNRMMAGRGQGNRFRNQQNGFINQPESVAEQFEEAPMVDNKINNLEKRMNNIEEKLDTLLKNLTPAEQNTEKKPDTAK